MNKTFRWLGVLALAVAIEGGAAAAAKAQTAAGTEPTANASGPVKAMRSGL